MRVLVNRVCPITICVEGDSNLWVSTRARETKEFIEYVI